MTGTGTEKSHNVQLGATIHHDAGELKKVISKVREIIEALGEPFASALDAIAGYTDDEAYVWLTEHCKVQKWNLSLAEDQNHQFSYADILLDNYRLRESFAANMAQQEAEYNAKIASGEKVTRPIWFVVSQ